MQGWRWAWIISGIPGIVLVAVILITVTEPQRNSNDNTGTQSEQTDVTEPDVNWRHRVAVICRMFFQPSLLMLCLAGSIRNAGRCAIMSHPSSLRLGGLTTSWSIFRSVLLSLAHTVIFIQSLMLFNHVIFGFPVLMVPNNFPGIMSFLSSYAS